MKKCLDAVSKNDPTRSSGSASGCRECGKNFDPMPDSLPEFLRKEFEKVDTCSACVVRMMVACHRCGQSRTYYDGWNCPTEGCETPETDAVEFEVIDDYECGINVVSSCLARKLERERDELRAKYAMHHAEAEKLTKVIRMTDAGYKLRTDMEFWQKMPAQEMRLRCGEMSNQEIRTVRAVLSIILSANAESIHPESKP